MKTFYLQSTLSLLALFRNLADAKSLRGLSSENMVCRITTVDTMLGEMSDLQSIGSESYDACIPIIDGKETHHLLPIVLEPTLRDQYQELVETGTLLVSIPGATIEGDQLIIPDSSQMKVYDEVPEHLRQLSALSRSPTGTMSVLVVRVTTKDGVSPSASLSTLRQHLFEATPSLKSQYEACSYNKLTFVDGGGLDVKLDQPSSSFSKPGQLLDAAMTKVMQIKGVSDVSSLADKVFFCQPGVVGGWLAVSPVNHWRMNFNDEWCTSLSANIHEVRHARGRHAPPFIFDIQSDICTFSVSFQRWATTWGCSTVGKAMKIMAMCPGTWGTAAKAQPVLVNASMRTRIGFFNGTMTVPSRSAHHPPRRSTWLPSLTMKAPRVNTR